MKVTFRQSGGVTGLIRGAEVDTSALPVSEASRLRALIRRSGLPKVRRTTSSPGRDLACYELTIEDRTGVHHLSFDDLTLPERLAPLLEFLQSQAKPLAPK